MKREIFHASCVAVKGNAVLILGPSGSGKSSFALEMMARGGVLVADDRTELFNHEDQLIASCPLEIRGKIEARGVGVLTAETISRAVIRLVVDLGKLEKDRLPEFRTETLCGQSLPLLYNTAHDQFPAAVLQYLKGGRIA